MELQTWVGLLELWINLIYSWVGYATCSFINILRKDDMGTNLQRTWKEEFLNKENIWEPICIELEKKYFEERKNGYPFAEILKKKSHDKLDQWVQHTSCKTC
jgi:hypothetical protein